MHDENADDDWAPLPSELLAERPGECVDLAVRRAPEPPPPPDPRAEQALRELQQRLARTPRSTSLVAALQRREQRTARRTEAAGRAGAELQAAVVVAAPPQPELVVDEHASDLDPRELEPWFRELPEAEQQRLRASWHGARHQFDTVALAHRRRLGRAAGYGALCFVLMGICQALLLGGFQLVPTLALAGAAAGLAAELCGGGRFTYGWAGSVAYVVVMGPMVFVQPLSLCTLLFAAYGMGMVGMDGEMRRSAGYRDA